MRFVVTKGSNATHTTSSPSPPSPYFWPQNVVLDLKQYALFCFLELIFDYSARCCCGGFLLCVLCLSTIDVMRDHLSIWNVAMTWRMPSTSSSRVRSGTGTKSYPVPLGISTASTP